MQSLISTFILLMTISSIKLGCGTYLERPAAIDEDAVIYKKYLETDKMLKEFINYGVKRILPYLLEASEHLNVSSNCTRDTFQLLNNIRKLKLSALKFLDASGKPPEGILEGNINMVGDHDQCLNTSLLKKDSSVAFRGQYCMIYLKFFRPKSHSSELSGGPTRIEDAIKNASELTKHFASFAPYFYENGFRFGACVPSGCAVEDISQMVKYITERSALNSSVEYCITEDDYFMTPQKVIAIGMFSLIGLISLAGTIMEYYCKEKSIVMKGRIPQILMCFSITRNFPKVIDTKVTDTSLSCIYGIRALSVFYIILAHQYFFQARLIFQDHMFHFIDQTKHLFGEILANSILTPDIFFFLGGLLNCYSRLKIKEATKRQPSILKLIIHRLWRIYPAYIFAIFVSYLLTARGPMANISSEEIATKCYPYPWKNLIFINNLFHLKDSCMSHAWYVAADFQLFLLSLLTVPLLLKNTRKGLLLNLALMCAGIVGCMIWVWYKNIMPAILHYADDKEKMTLLADTYQTPLPHIAPYFTGILVGYFLRKKKDLKFSKGFQFVGWLVASLAFTSMLFLPHRWNTVAQYTKVESALYFGLSRLVYTAAVAWMMVCCFGGYGGIVNYILSLKIWIPISRMSYMVYLVSPILQLFYVRNRKTPTDSHPMVAIWNYFGDITLSCLLGLAMVVITESPFISMEKIIFQRNSSTETKDSVDQDTVNIRSVANENNKNSTVLEINLGNTVAHTSLQLQQ